MTDSLIGLPAAVHVVLADANVLYSRVLRDYLLSAAEQEIVNVFWSRAILGDVTRHLMADRPGFDEAAAKRLVDAVTDTFPRALVEPDAAAFAQLEGIALPHENDRSVIAAAITAEAGVICTNNLKHFPATVLERFGMAAMAPDDLFAQLIVSHGDQMRAAHELTVASLAHATDASTIAALRKAGAAKTADLMAGRLGLSII